MTSDDVPLLDIADLRVGFAAGRQTVDAVRGVSFSLGRERLAIVGESGSGKSMTVRALLGLAGPSAFVTAAKARFHDTDLLAATERQLRTIRGKRIAMIVQDPKQGLNPMLRVGRQIEEMLPRREGETRAERRGRIVALLEEVRIKEASRVADLYPHQLSGGMAQRAMIAMMLASEPEILIADEATSALDVGVQQRILELIDEQVTRRGMGLILISHDVDLAARHADRILVMYAGRIVEELSARTGYEAATHPYTHGLIACRPRLARPGGMLPTLTRDPTWAFQ